MQYRSIISVKVLAATAAVAAAALAPAAHAGSAPTARFCAWPSNYTPLHCVAAHKAPRVHNPNASHNPPNARW